MRTPFNAVLVNTVKRAGSLVRFAPGQLIEVFPCENLPEPMHSNSYFGVDQLTGAEMLLEKSEVVLLDRTENEEAADVQLWNLLMHMIGYNAPAIPAQWRVIVHRYQGQGHFSGDLYTASFPHMYFEANTLDLLKAKCRAYFPKIDLHFRPDFSCAGLPLDWS